MNKIELRSIEYEYRDPAGRHIALRDVNLTIAEGEFLCIVGHSGCGKSTLLSLIAGLRAPTAGSIRIDGVPITGTGTDRGIVFQNYSLFPWLTAKKNVMFGIRQANRACRKREAAALAERYLREVGLADAMDKYPFQLSGGMQQRVAIARVLAMDADILLLDEPFGALDPRIRYALQEFLEDIWLRAAAQGRKKTVIFVTHDVEEAIVLGSRIVFMEPGCITREIAVDFPRPRRRRELVQTPACCALRKELIELFYESEDKRNA